jgi:hypothetical protein
MYSPIGCLKKFRQEVEKYFAQREIDFLSYVVTKEVSQQT